MNHPNAGAHARVLHTCPTCGRQIHGSGFYNHRNHCKGRDYVAISPTQYAFLLVVRALGFEIAAKMVTRGTIRACWKRGWISDGELTAAGRVLMPPRPESVTMDGMISRGHGKPNVELVVAAKLPFSLDPGTCRRATITVTLEPEGETV